MHMACHIQNNDPIFMCGIVARLWTDNWIFCDIPPSNYSGFCGRGSCSAAVVGRGGVRTGRVSSFNPLVLVTVPGNTFPSMKVQIRGVKFGQLTGRWLLKTFKKL